MGNTTDFLNALGDLELCGLIEVDEDTPKIVKDCLPIVKAGRALNEKQRHYIVRFLISTRYGGEE